jgi:hypothetical protein
VSWAADLIEHLGKEDGFRLLEHMELIARKVVVIVTPNGFIAQHLTDGNPLQIHRSGWTAHEMKALGYAGSTGGVRYEAKVPKRGGGHERCGAESRTISMANDLEAKPRLRTAVRQASCELIITSRRGILTVRHRENPRQRPGANVESARAKASLA